MTFLIFSDVHLSRRFDQKKFDFLKKIIEKADRVIINGDFWEGFDFSFSQFVNSPWKKLFPLLKKKKAIYIYGNHDEKKLSDERANLFSVKQGARHIIKIRNKTFIIEHGQRLLPMIDKVFFNDVLGINPPPFSNKFYERLEFFLVKFFGKWIIKKLYSEFNRKTKLAIKAENKKDHLYILGHTHLAEIDTDAGFINSGFIRHGIGQYLTLDDTGKVTAHEERYR